VKPCDRVLTVERRRISTWTGNADVPGIDWTGRSIELIYVNCGRTFDENNAWWRIFSPAFIPRRTLIVNQDWQVYKETPPKPYNQTKEFTDSKGKILRLLHALRRGGVDQCCCQRRPSIQQLTAPPLAARESQVEQQRGGRYRRRRLEQFRSVCLRQQLTAPCFQSDTFPPPLINPCETVSVIRLSNVFRRSHAACARLRYTETRRRRTAWP